MDYEQALQLIGHESCELRQVKKQYQALCKIIDNYTFTPQQGVSR